MDADSPQSVTTENSSINGAKRFFSLLVFRVFGPASNDVVGSSEDTS